VRHRISAVRGPRGYNLATAAANGVGEGFGRPSGTLKQRGDLIAAVRQAKLRREVVRYPLRLREMWYM